ncbi:hypothetical protein [Paenarthrobacter sp. AB444]|uniref:hypothetical protein n=1 Tax=Paenarthrobacter sp. AB444 TaxID=3025681 RepID=UPI00236661D7|nr:hypothetical protein [Paenarthrobacter sp. AB444]MDD7837244.1 hypothetical protein [Paenarthrobacter sp. AB444]
MGEIRADSRLNIVEISPLAWAATVRKAAEAMDSSQDAELAAYQASLQAQGDVTPEVAEELLRAGILDARGVMSQQWVLAVFLAASAPLRASTIVQRGDTVQSGGTAQFGDTAQSGGTLESVHTEVGMAGGRGVGLSYRRRISTEAGGGAVTEVRNAVEVSFFREEDAWASLSRHFPDLPRLVDSPDNLPQATAADVGCTIHLEVTAVPPGRHGFQPYQRRHSWGVAERLYSVEASRGDAATASWMPVPATDIASEFAWSVLGGREYLASARVGADAGAGAGSVHA